MSRTPDYMISTRGGFFSFQDTEIAAVDLNKVLWLINLLALAAIKLSQTAYVNAYNATKNPKTRTAAQMDVYKTTRKQYRADLRKFNNDNVIYNTSIPHDDKIAMGINPHDGVRVDRPAITVRPAIIVKSLVGTTIDIKTYQDAKNPRPSVLPNADGVEVRYLINVNAPPATADDCTQSVVNTKSHFVINCPTADKGKTFSGFARWLNFAEPKKNGPWSLIFEALLIP